MSYGFRAGGHSRTRRQPKVHDDIVSALRRSLAADDSPRSSPRGSMPRTGLPADLNQRMPVNLSNGEFEFTPEQIYAIGLHTLAAMRHGGRPGFDEGTTKNRLNQQAEANATAKGAGGVLQAIPQFYSGLKSVKDGDYLQGANDLFGGVGGTFKALSDGMSNVKTLGSQRAGSIADTIAAGQGLNNTFQDFRKGQYKQGIGDGVDAASKAVSAANGWMENAPDKLGLASKYLNLAGSAKSLDGAYTDYKNGDYLKGTGEAIDGVNKGLSAMGKGASPYLSALQAGQEAVSGGTSLGNGDWSSAFSHFTKGLAPATAATALLGESSLPIAAAGGASIPAIAAGVPLLVAGMGGATIGTAAYNHVPQVRDVSGGIWDSLTQSVANKFGHYTEAQKGQILNEEANRELAERNRIAAAQGEKVYLPNLADNSALAQNAGKSGWERAGNVIGSVGTQAILGPDFAGNPTLAMEKQQIIDQFRKQQEEARQKRAQAATPQISQ